MAGYKTIKEKFRSKKLYLSIHFTTLVILSATAIATTVNAQTNTDVRFRGVVIGEPNFNNTLGVGGANVLLYDIISPGTPVGNLTIGKVVTVTWSIAPPFAGTKTS
jgi:hypothetical protein